MAKTLAMLLAASSMLDAQPTMPAGLKIRKEPTAADVLVAFEAFKTAHDAEMKEIKARGAADPLTTEKLNKIDAFMTDAQAQLDDIAKRMKRPGAPAGGEGDQDAEAVAYRDEVRAYVRRGVDGQRLQARAMSVSDNSQGGYFTSHEVDTEIAKLARNNSPVREIAAVGSSSAVAWKKRISKSNNSSGWVGEQSARPQTDPSDFVEVTITPHEIYANVYVTQNLLDDATLNLEAWIAEETNAEFGVKEGVAFISGNGVTQPQGMILPSGSLTLESDTTFAAQGKLGYLKTGSETALQAGETEAADRLINLQTQLKDAYQPNARFLMNRFTLRAVRKLKDENSQYLWQPGVDKGSPGLILGKPYTILDDMPSMAHEQIPILYGDFRQYYRVQDRLGVRILRDPYSAVPYVRFYITKRVGGGVVLTEACKGLMCDT